MKPAQIISINAILFLALGIACMVYAPLPANLFGVQDIPETDSLLYWNVISFIRMFGAALFGAGLIVFALRRHFPALPDEAARGLLSALLLGNLALFLVTIVQQASIWGSLAGWVFALVFLIFTIAYGILLSRYNSSTH